MGESTLSVNENLDSNKLKYTSVNANLGSNSEMQIWTLTGE